ncbi:MAG: glycoside hydrolase family 27 protein, partial [Candidatus Saccharibacteria bacterium]
AIESYTLMRDALYAAKRPIVFSICEWGVSKPWEWASGIGHLWRTTGDIQNNWNIPDAKEGKCWAGGVVINLDMQQGLEKYAGTDHWNDPDMLEVGNGGLTPSESRAHFSLWCMLAAPLFAGNDLSSMDAPTRAILTNPELIAIDQDPLGKQGFKIKDYGELEIYYKPLQNNQAAICIFNRFDTPVTIEMDWKTFNLKASIQNKSLVLSPKIDRNDFQPDGRYEVLDLWANQKQGNTSQMLHRVIEAHDVAVYRLSK